MKHSDFFLFFFFAVCALPAAAVSPSGTLPVLHIETANRQTIDSKEVYLQATYWLDPLSTGEEAFGSEQSPLPLQIKGRGNWTWSGFDKKPYRLKLDKKASLMGLKANKHFALLAHADDNHGFLRNTVGFWLSEQIGMAWTPKQRPVEVVLNGDYVGLYFLTELIRVDNDRVNITEQSDLCTNVDSVTGGWLVEIDNYDSDPHIQITEGDGQRIIFTYKSPEVLSSAQEQFLTKEMTRINQLVYGDKNSDELWQYLDIDALARFFIVQELTDNYESFHGSCYLYRDMGSNEKWYFGPVWDFGSAFNYDKTRPFYEGREHHNTWAPQLAQFPAFRKRVQEIWSELYYGNYDAVYTYTSDFVQHITSAARKDAERWQSKGYGNNDMQSDLMEVQRRLRQAAQWMNSTYGLTDNLPCVERNTTETPLKILTTKGELFIIRNGITYRAR
ncbi:MAG: CotH kinase family protein [Paludibacteraceae bacterium]